MNNIYVKFENDGEIDVNAFKLIGASSKETDDTKIGFWGSGLKYAIAVLLRHNIAIKAFSGKKEIKIGKRNTKMRGESFEVVTINGSPTSITTRMGKDWELWFAIREITANAIDEGGDIAKVTDDVSGEHGKTKIFIEFTDEIKEIYNNINSYFCYNRKPIYSHHRFKIFDRLNTGVGIIYRRGIKVGEKNDLSFDYDIDDVSINESRVIHGFRELDRALTSHIKNIDDEYFINMFLLHDYGEWDLDWTWAGTHFSKKWKNCLQGYKIIPKEVSGYYLDEMNNPHYILPTQICELLKSQYGKDVDIAGYTSRGMFNYKKLQPTEKQSNLIEEMRSKIEKVISTEGIDIEIGILDIGILGKALPEERKIIISDSVFSRGKSEILKTMIEEYSHVVSGADDRTRQFQDFLIGIIATQLE